jgi:DNA-binding transcriptional MerR regulator/methylmalonyl-CoA mutase cobalamin-binding subunit
MHTRYHEGMDRTTEPPDLSRYSAAPHYNIQAVEKATGVSSRTLRSWERRYGTPRPQRDESGRRLYSERDLVLIRWLTDRVGQGISIGRAVAMLAQEGTEGQSSGPPPDLDRLQLRLLQAMDWMDEDEAAGVLALALETAPVETVVLDLIEPVMQRVGELWAGGRLSVASEHFGTHVVRSLLADLLRRSSPAWRPYHVLVGSAPGEQHDLGALVLALFLRHAGFRVTYLGANLEGESLKADLQRIRPHAVCLSATTRDAAEALAALYDTIGTTYHGVLAYGGSAFRGSPEDRVQVPGLFLGADAERAIDVLTAALQQNEAAS